MKPGKLCFENVGKERKKILFDMSSTFPSLNLSNVVPRALFIP